MQNIQNQYQRCISLILCIAILIMQVTPAFAQTRPTLLLDAEIDDYINGLAKPFLKEAGFSPENVHVLVLKDPSINAFVNSQTAIFVMSGLMLKAQSANEVVGVLAHEIGHLKGHHILRLHEERSSFSFPALIGGVLGIGAVAAGAPDAGTALLAGGQAASIANFLKFSRSQEQQADQIAANLLEKLKVPTAGLKNFFSRLRTQALLYHRATPAYLQTHPRNQDRQSFLDALPQTNYAPTLKEAAQFKRIQAKLYALTHTPAQTKRKFLYEDAPEGYYALAIAAFLEHQYEQVTFFLEKFIKATNIQNKPYINDPYITELKAHIALLKNKFEQADTLFKKAVHTNPNSILIRFGYARNLRIKKDYNQAIIEYTYILQKHPEWWAPHQELGLIYGKTGRFAEAQIALAKAALYRGKKADARLHLNLATQYLKDIAAHKRIFKEQEIKLLHQELER